METVLTKVRKRVNRTAKGTVNNQQTTRIKLKRAFPQKTETRPNLGPEKAVKSAVDKEAVNGFNPFNLQKVRGQYVILEQDLAFALGTVAARLEGLAERKPEWFSSHSRFQITSAESSSFDLWWMRLQKNYLTGNNRSIVEEALPQMPVAYSLQGVIAATHLLIQYAQEEVDACPVELDILPRFRKLRRVMSEA